jgi:hypothetical protein
MMQEVSRSNTSQILIYSGSTGQDITAAYDTLDLPVRIYDMSIRVH